MNIIKSVEKENYINLASWHQYFGDLKMGVFDIETTGLSPKYAQLILAALFVVPSEYKNSSSIFFQFFANDLSDEKAVLEEIDSSMASIDFVLTFNGKSFDMPFYEKRRHHHKLPPISAPYNLDLYALIKNYSQVGQFTPNLKQKTLENFMGLWDSRKDEISGKESIDLYYNYMSTQEEALKSKILLHNRDDVLQLYRLLSILNKVDLHRAMYHMGFPVVTNNYSFIVNKIAVKNSTIYIQGSQNTKSEEPLRCVHYGENTLSYKFTNHDFWISLPIIKHKSLTLVDLIDIDYEIKGSINGYLVVANGDEIAYDHVNLFAITIIKAISNMFRCL